MHVLFKPYNNINSLTSVWDEEGGGGGGGEVWKHFNYRLFITNRS